MWKFTNSNQGAELEIQTLPNSFIQFTVLAAILRIQDNIRRILNQEAKSKIHPSKRLFNSIANHNWYSFEKYILIKKNKAKKSKSKSTRKKTTSLTDGIPNLLENNQNMLDPFIPLLYSVIVLDYKFEYLEKIIQIVDKINQIIPADQLPEREYVQLQIIIRNSIDEMIKNKSIDSNFLEKVFGYAPNGQKFHDSLLPINTFLRLKLSSELLNQFKEKIHSELGSEWQQYLEHDIEVPDISSEESQKEFFKVLCPSG